MVRLKLGEVYSENKAGLVAGTQFALYGRRSWTDCGPNPGNWQGVNFRGDGKQNARVQRDVFQGKLHGGAQGTSRGVNKVTQTRVNRVRR